MAEHRTVAAVVAGSTPVVRPKSPLEISPEDFFLNLDRIFPRGRWGAYGSSAMNPQAK